MSDVPTVTVLIPARNEEADIERCLRAVLAQDHSHDRMEIVLVDGGSTDRTALIASRTLAGGDISWKIVDNPAATTPSNLNAGLAKASGQYLCRVDARSLVPADYVQICSDVLDGRPDVSVVGGTQVAVAPAPTVKGRGIARALNNCFSMGGARYRSASTSGATDTVYLGAFRTSELRALGGWDEVLVTNQDYELNRRMEGRGTVWFDDRLRVGYVPRSTLLELWTQYHRFGRWKVRYWRHTRDRPQRRQMVLLVGAPVVAMSVTALVVAVRTWPRRSLVVGGALAVIMTIEDQGSAGPAGGPASRAVSAVAMLTVGSSWLIGAWREFIAPAQ